MRALWTAAALTAAMSLTTVGAAAAAVPGRDPDALQVVRAHLASLPMPAMPVRDADPVLPDLPVSLPVTLPTSLPSLPVSLPTGLPTSLPSLPALPALPTGLPSLPTLPSLPATPDLSGLTAVLSGVLATINSLLAILGLPPITLPSLSGLSTADPAATQQTVNSLQRAADQLTAAASAAKAGAAHAR